MKKFLFITFIFFTACATNRDVMVEYPDLVSIHIIDREGMTEAIANPDRLENYAKTNFLEPQPYQKVLRVYSRDECGDIRAYITTYHPNGYVKQYLEVVNNRAFGIYREWFPNGLKKVEAQIIEGTPDISLGAEKTWIFDGQAKAWDECGHLVADIPYCHGVQQGIARYFHKNGALWKEIPYVSGAISGEVHFYLESGTLLQTTQYLNGIKHGPSLRYWKEQKIASEEMYEQGRLMSASYFDLEGAKISTISKGCGERAVFGKESISELQEYQNGFQEGVVKAFDVRGRLIKQYSMKKGVKHGEEIIYFPNQQPKMLLTWYEGKIQGPSKTWYDNGQMESQRELSNNEKNGMAIAWYRDGQMMLIEEYEHNQLKRGDYYRKGDKNPISQITNGQGIATFFDPEGNYLRKINYLLGKPED